MTPDLQLELRRNARRRAHIAGAEAAALAAEAARLTEAAAAAKRLYFRELETADLLSGHRNSFAALGVEP